MNKYWADRTQQNPPKAALAAVSIVGARGYSGLELARLLMRHPGVRLTHAFATQAFRLADDLHDDGIEAVTCLPDQEILTNLTDIVFLATPAEVSLKLAPQILVQGKRVIDLSGAFRLHKKDPAPWYGFKRADAALMEQTEYGLVPNCGPLSPSKRLIANPGCYATAISLALIPLLKRDLIDKNTLVIDAKSGASGAGKKAAENLLFCEVDADCLPYRVGKHQHLPEIQEAVESFSGAEIDPHFVTHLLPVKRGITAGIFAKAKTTDIARIAAAFEEEYAAYPLLRHGSVGPKYSSLKHVVGTPFTHVSYELVNDKLYVFSAIDNLLKGAASQAVENLNRFLDLPVHSGLTTKEQ